MFVVRVKEKAQMKDQSDFFEILRAAPPPSEPLMSLQPMPEENACTFA
jgi:hypothetical protein